MPTDPLYLNDNNDNNFNYSQPNSPIVVKTFAELPNKIFFNVHGNNGLASPDRVFSVYRLIVDLSTPTTNQTRWTVIDESSSTSSTGAGWPNVANQFLNHAISNGIPLLYYLEDALNKKMSVYSIK